MRLTERVIMSRYTIQLRDVVNLYGKDTVLSWFKDYDEATFLTHEELDVIKSRGTWSKDRLAEKILNHYLIYEIGFETPALFAHQVKVEMNELMEEYLPLIYSSSIKYDPMVNVDFTETFHQTEQGNSTTNGSSNSTNTNDTDGLTIHSDTPQGNIDKQRILQGDYASSTDGTETHGTSNDNTESESNTDTNAVNDYVKTTKGNSGVSATAQKMIEQYRDNIRAIDREIIEKLNVLFMGVF